MIKKLLITLAFICSLFLQAHADVMPYYIGSINTSSMGVYQASNSIKIYQEPNENSTLLLDAYWNSKVFNSPEVSASNLFIVFLQKRELALLLVLDETEDWVQVIYNRNTNQKGWLKKDDPMKFSNWLTFYNNYGRKYGLYFMKDAPASAKNLYSSNIEDSQKLGLINFPQTIRLTAIKGNWLLVNVFDMDRLQKIGYIKWRSSTGEIYVFPDIK